MLVVVIEVKMSHSSRILVALAVQQLMRRA